MSREADSEEFLRSMKETHQDYWFFGLEAANFESKVRLFKDPPKILSLDAKDELEKKMIACCKQLLSENRNEEA